MTEADLKAMPLHDYVEIDLKLDFSFIHRVPNGWNYVYSNKGSIAVQFVPEVLPILQYAVPRE